MTLTLQFSADEARLVYLALVYHLGRPGSELDATTMLPGEHGLGKIERQLAGHAGMGALTLDFDADQHRKLVAAMSGCVNELRVYHMSNGGAAIVPRFNETARALFPDVDADPEAALSVAEAMMMLRRRLAASARPISGPLDRVPTGKRSRWPFRR
jgi:hypothetical protein